MVSVIGPMTDRVISQITHELKKKKNKKKIINNIIKPIIKDVIKTYSNYIIFSENKNFQ
jgi:glutamine synthetase type III